MISENYLILNLLVTKTESQSPLNDKSSGACTFIFGGPLGSEGARWAQGGGDGPSSTFLVSLSTVTNRG